MARRDWRGGAIAALLAATVLVGSAQDRPIPDRLAAIQQALFSGKADVQASIRDLKAILATEPQSHVAHVLLGIAYRSLGPQRFTASPAADSRPPLPIPPP